MVVSMYSYDKVERDVDEIFEFLQPLQNLPVRRCSGREVDRHPLGESVLVRSAHLYKNLG